ncbi:RES domain-containing protein [Streptomyces dioscori]|uniref:RES domain-containing protein n=1 Tax=Streptomyces dioscori TaxID=2109333 RepID=A0A2P8PW35_9ACTN|nr:RES family NAD+ phosphorylase [Streptomyces dioscori]PSM38208.1 RES domain-containing protein [Streptomyces dioscori]
MPRGAQLPEKGLAKARPATWKAGTVLYRVHHAKWDPDAFNPEPQDPHFGGYRFGPTRKDSYSTLFAAPLQATALNETLVRGLSFAGLDDAGRRLLPRKEVEGRLLSQVELTRDVRLVSLMSAPDMAAVAQTDMWLSSSDATEYAFTRRWGDWLRSEADWADGFVWRSRFDSPRTALVLFGSPEGSDLVGPTGHPSAPLDDKPGIRRVNRLLARYRAVIAPPSDDDPVMTRS